MNPCRIARCLWRALQLGLASLPQGLLALALVALAAVVPTLATAADDEDPPGRVGRLAQVDGEVLWYDSESGAWETAERNRPLTGGDRLSTGPGSRAELRVGSTVLRLAAASELEVRRLDDERMVFELHSGSLALRVRTRELADEIELVTREARLAPRRAGHYRLDRIDDSTQAGSWRGELRVLGAGGLDIGTGEHVELWREGPGDGDERRLAHTRTPLPQDDFAAWALRADQTDTRSASARHVSPEMTGIEDLDRHGRWDRHPEYGALWFPLVVAADWAPYRHGRWLWTVRWGWTWVDAAPWGFAPFHYGRWVHYGGRWAWAPGSYVRRPVFAPALVAWVGGPQFGLSLHIGGGADPGYPHVGWVPLAPREAYRPWYRASPGHVERIDRHHAPRERARPRPRPGEAGRPTIPERVDRNPQQWVNQRAPGGVTVVPRDALFRRDPVQRVVVAGPQGTGRPWPGREALPAQTPPMLERPQRPQRPPLPQAIGPQRPGVVVQTERHAPDRIDARQERAGRDRRDGREDRDRRDRRDRRDDRFRPEDRPPARAGATTVDEPPGRAGPDRSAAVEPRPAVGVRPAPPFAGRDGPPPRPVRPAQTLERPAQQATPAAPPRPAAQPQRPAPPARAPLPQRAPAAATAERAAVRAEVPRGGGPPSRARSVREERARH